MNRLKLLLFAFPLLALWSFVGLREDQRTLSHAQASRAAVLRQAGEAVSARLEERRAQLGALAERIATSPELSSALARAGSSDEVSANRVKVLRGGLAGLIPQTDPAGWVVGLASASAQKLARGNAEPAGLPAGLSADIVLGSHAKGVLSRAFGDLRVIYSFPLPADGSQPADKPSRAARPAKGKKAPKPKKGAAAHQGAASPAPAVMLVLGPPLLPAHLADAVAADLKLDALGLSSQPALPTERKFLESAGANASLERARTALAADRSGVIERAGLKDVDGYPLPLVLPLTQPPPRLLAARISLAAAPLEVVAVASLAPDLEALWRHQLEMAAALAISGVWWLLFLLWMRSAPRARAAASASPPTLPPQRPAASLSREPGTEPPAPAQAPLTEPPWASESQVQPLATGQAPAAAPASLADFPEPDPFALGERTMVASAADLQRAAQESGGSQSPPEDEGFNPEATRVASVPAELLRQSAQAPEPEPGAPAGSDQEHDQQLFQDFVATRDQCGEAPDGLTFEKFQAKIQKNRVQMIEKYNCRTVRFQVYVKDGKAALKATPVK